MSKYIHALPKVNLTELDVKKRADEIRSTTTPKLEHLIKAVQCMDLTTLNANDTDAIVEALAARALDPLGPAIINKLPQLASVRTAAVCVYPVRVPAVVKILGQSPIKIASVAAGFPSGQYPLATRLAEIRAAVAFGANEIDIVIDRSLAVTGQWDVLFDEIAQMKEACGSAHMKTILAVGELLTYENIFYASIVAMYAGSDFIKTSTGKETVNATLEFGVVMCRAIRVYYDQTKRRVGLKPAGGIRKCEDAVDWLNLIEKELGDEWLRPELFRIGASGLLDDLRKRIGDLNV